MAPFFEHVCKEHGVAEDAALLKQMQSANEEKLKQLDEAIKGTIVSLLC